MLTINQTNRCLHKAAVTASFFIYLIYSFLFKAFLGNLYSNINTGDILTLGIIIIYRSANGKVHGARHRIHFQLVHVSRYLDLSLSHPLCLSVFSFEWETRTLTLQRTVTIATCEFHSLYRFLPITLVKAIDSYIGTAYRAGSTGQRVKRDFTVFSQFDIDPEYWKCYLSNRPAVHMTLSNWNCHCHCGCQVK